MARPRKKKRTHLGHGTERSAAATVNAAGRHPKSMVIRIGAGDVGTGVSQLAKDLRSILEPGTASRLKERRSNKLRDYVTMAGPLGVSHLFLLSRSNLGNTNLRIGLTPRGPTLTFRVQTYALSKDVQRVQKHPQSRSKDFLSPPLLVMSNFTGSDYPGNIGSGTSTVPKHLETLVTSVFQSVFPPIKPNDTPISSIHRVILLTRHNPQLSEAGNFVISLRHYKINSKPAKISRGLHRLSAANNNLRKRKQQERTAPKLNRLDDIADLLLDPASSMADYTSNSESEVGTEAEVDVVVSETKRVPSHRQAARVQAGQRSRAKLENGGAVKRRIKLQETGPRLQLRMTKVEEDLCGGKVLWHDYVEKTAGELQALDLEWEKRRAAKSERQKIQNENIEKKRRSRPGLSEDPHRGNSSESMEEIGNLSTVHGIQSWSETDASDEDEVLTT